MIFPRSLVPVALMTLAVAGTAACKQEPPAPTAEPTASASAQGRAKMPPRAAPPMAKVDPQSMKEYRSDICFFGTLTLRQARDAYLASLGKDEPSEKKIPNFGMPTPPSQQTGATTPTVPGATPVPGSKPTTATGATGATSAKPTAGPPASAKAAAAAPPKTTPGSTPSAKPAAAAAAMPSGKPGEPPKSATDMRPETRRPFDLAMRAQHDRNARACKVAADLKEPAMGDLDAALAAFAPFAMELAKDVGTASLYYQREEYKKDEFKQGKELHKKLLGEFAKLDELSDKVGAAIVAWRKDHAPDPTKTDEGEKLADAAGADAREIMLGLLTKKIDVAAHKERVAKLEKSAEALKTYGTTNTADPWSKNLGPSLDSFIRTLKDDEPKITDKGVQPEAFLGLINGMTNVIEARYRALTRALIAKGQTLEPGVRPSAPLVARPTAAPETAPPATSGAPQAPHPE